MPRNKTTRILEIIAIMTAASAVAWGGVYKNTFHFDDQHAITRNPSIRDMRTALSSFRDATAFSFYRTPMIRPVTIVSYAINYRFSELRPRGWMITNAVIHFANSLLALLLAFEILKRKGDPDRALPAALIAGLVFAVHPIQSETINYLSARSMLLAVFFYLSGLIAAMKIKGHKGTAVACVMFVFALLCREDAATFPAALMLIDLITGADREGKEGRLLWNRVARWAPFWVLLEAYFIYRKSLLGVAVGKGFVRPIWENILLQAWSVGLYQKLLVWPRGFSLSHPDKGVAIGTALWIVAAAAIAVELAAAFFSRKKAPIVTVGVCWYFLTQAVSIVIPLNQLSSEHRVYMATLGPSLIFGWALSILLEDEESGSKRIRRALTVGVGAFIVVLALVSRTRSGDYVSDKALWTSTTKVYPNYERGWSGVGYALKEEGNLIGSIDAYNKSVSIRETPEAYNNLSLVCGMAKDVACMEESMMKSLALDPNNPVTLFNYSQSLLQKGDVDNAEAALRKAIAIRKVFPEAHRNLAVLLYRGKRGSTEEIIKLLETSLRQDPYQNGASNMAGIIENLKNELNKEKMKVP